MRPKVNGPKAGTETFKYDSLKWLLVLVIVAAGIVANSYYGDVAGALRAAIGIVVAAIIVGIASQTAKGQRAWTFMKGSRTELRKVVWPTRQETIQTAMVVVAMVIVMAIILWGVDTLFLWLVSLLTRVHG